jgi:hypothetical protein
MSAKRQRYTLWGGQDGTEVGLPDSRWSTTIMATSHFQHIWNETILCGVSEAVEKRVYALAGNGHFYCDAGRYSPRVIGFTRS